MLRDDGLVCFCRMFPQDLHSLVANYEEGSRVDVHGLIDTALSVGTVFPCPGSLVIAVAPVSHCKPPRVRQKREKSVNVDCASDIS